MPPGVPSLFHSSKPWASSNAKKNSVDPTTTELSGSSNVRPIDFTSTVPSSVPSLLHSDVGASTGLAAEEQLGAHGSVRGVKLLGSLRPG